MVLDSWRGLAALGVVWHHVGADNAFFANALHNGMSYAVDFFFVLSGFVIASSYGERLAGGFSVGRFMFLRAARLWPLHLVVLAGFVLLELAFLGLGSIDFLKGREPFGEGRDLGSLLATTFLLQEYAYPGLFPWNTASWSISVEIGLYLFAGLAFHLLGRRAVYLSVAVSIAAGFVLMAGGNLAFSGILRGLAGFGLGLALYPLWLRLRDVEFGASVATAAELVAVVAILSAVAYSRVTLATDLVFSAAILLFAFQRGLVSRLLLTPAFVWLGTLSYSIYMVHGMVVGRSYDLLALVQWATGWRLVQSGLGGADRLLMSAPVTVLVFAVMALMTVALAYLTWHFVEDPARRWSKRKAAQWGAARAEAVAPTI